MNKGESPQAAENRRARARKYQQERRDRRLAAGACVKCNGPNDRIGVALHCSKCAERYAEWFQSCK